MSLPLPTTLADNRRPGTCLPTLSKRSLKLIFACALVLVTLSFYSLSPSFGSSAHPVDISTLERILDHASSTVVREKKPDHNSASLTVLGLEADESFHLGSTALSEYRTELEDFVIKAFPTKYQEVALASIRHHLDDTHTQTQFAPIPQTYVSIPSLLFDAATATHTGHDSRMLL